MNYVCVRYGANELKLLCDTGASISCLFSDYVKDVDKIDTSKIIKIKGIAGSTHSVGSAKISFNISNELINHEFCIVDKFDSNIQGVLGSDFFSKYGAIIDYEKFLFSFWKNYRKITVPLDSETDEYTVIPPRCEVIKFCFTDNTDECIIQNEEVCEGVLVGAAIVKAEGNKIPVRLLNVNEREIKLRNFRPKVESITNYEVYQYNCNKISVDRVDKVLDMINTKSLTTEELSSIEKICAKYADIFHLDGDPLTVTNIYRQKIRLKEGASPVYVKPYRLPHAQKDEIHRLVEKMQQEGIIEEARSEWSSPLLVVGKKADHNNQKKYRVVVDYRLLNKQIQDEKFPLPNITDILDSLSGAVYFSHLDLAQGYYQLELDPESRPFTAFTTDRGQFQMKRLAMGMKISPSAFSRLMTVAMSGLNYDSCFIYLDDLIVFGNSLQNHNKNLVKVFERLRQVNLKLNPSKCEFLKKEILYLGHVISSEGISPDPEKIRAIFDYPVPKNSDETKRFVAFANYYRKFIKNFAQIAQPLNNLSRKNKIFQWSDECQNSFDTLRHALLSPPVLQYPNFSENNEFILRVDASAYALGAVLSNSDDRPVAFASRSLNKAEKNYSTVHKEMLALVWSMKHFRPYLFGRKFKVLTDHRPLVYLFSMTDPSSRLTKFRLALEEYDFSVHHVKGTENVTADALSRIVIESSELKNMSDRENERMNVMTRAQSRNKNNQEQERNNASTSIINGLDHPTVVEVLKQPEKTVELRLLLETEFNIKVKNKKQGIHKQINNFIYDKDSQIIYTNQNHRSASDLGTSLRDLEKICAENNISEVFIMRNKDSVKFLRQLHTCKAIVKNLKIKLIIVRDLERINNKELRQLILNDFHTLPTGGHAGINRMYNNIKRRYFWQGLKKDVEGFVKRCDDCQRCKHSKPNKEPMTITPTASSAFQKIFLDLVGPLPTDSEQNKYILTIQCDLTKFIEAYPIPDKETITVAKAFVENFILRFGIPLEAVTDLGSEYMSSTFQEACKLLDIKHLKSTAYHHQTLGSLENSHKHLGAYLRMRLAKEANNWSSWIPYWCFSYNNTVHTSTLYTPHELVFGTPGRIPSNIENTIDPLYNFDNYPAELKFRLQTAWNDARSNLLAVKLKQKSVYDKNCKEVSYKIGDMVLVSNENKSNKMDMLFKGPYKVLEDKGCNIVVDVNNKHIEIHKNRVKQYYD